MIQISEHLAKDILAHMECNDCETCRLNPDDCSTVGGRIVEALRGALEDAERNESVSQETVVNNAALVAEPEQATKYITITVAEYHFLTKATTLLEAIMHAPMHDRHALIEAAQKTIAFSEAGAAE